MAETQVQETTSLLRPSQPQYVFESSIARARKRRVKQFQCCVCTIFLVGVTAAVVITVAYSINDNDNPISNDNSTAIESDVVPLESFLVLLNSRNWPLNDEISNGLDNITTDIQDALIAGKKALSEKDRMETYNPSLSIDSPSYRHQKAFSFSEKARNLSRKGYAEEYATRYLYGIQNDLYELTKICFNDGTDESGPDYCSPTPSESCNVYQKYRSYDGSCNNLRHSALFGVANTPFRRGLPADYADGISQPRASRSGTPLPSARVVSIEVHRPYYREDLKFSVMLAVWGQFLDHDITATAPSRKNNGDTISCCGNQAYSSPECFPVLVEPSDPLAKYNISCMEFVRSAPSPTCCLGPREQMNQVTSFIDGSVVYGADESKAQSLRTFEGGFLKTYVTKDNRTLLPISHDMADGCNRDDERERGRYCFLAGDDRANENLHLVTMHLIWVRQHNRLATQLSTMNPHWNDEILFQEARRLVGAQMQHITYNEFLPILLGDRIMKQFQLSPQQYGYFNKYSDHIDPNIANEFATAAFRFAHTIIPGLIKLLANDSTSPEYVQMHKMLFDPFALYDEGELDRILRGAMNTSIEASDSYFSNELKSHMFERDTKQTNESKKCGLDLVSLNIQRGRDHGLPGYVFWRKKCGLAVPHTFDNLREVMDRDPLENIKSVYRTVEDIDLYSGAVSEKPLEGSILGPTFTCLILDQFMRIKYGDRFWYENSCNWQSFTGEQLNEIRKTTLSGVICDNADDLSYIQPRVMERSGNKNEYTNCASIPKPNLKLWQDKLNRLRVPTTKLNVITFK
ncbi:lactoperoxidase isoform X2 [Cylas formicarius]|uniref:lactoperoxidase isoform X2 n=1 Tax=Cylas formicarius TaxID=197179 RepID=UPI0029583483|nr:lactoperoxidase isoform X2 [Cylas formicarius]